MRRPAVGGFSLRTGVPEERFVPLGMGRSRRVRDILADRKTPHVVRSRIPMLTAEGEPVWLVGVRISDDWKVGAPTDPFVCLRVRRDEGVRPP
ncbi:MAG: tRNA lysidine(34) synthetase TilS [Chloroflexia bacterium]